MKVKHLALLALLALPALAHAQSSSRARNYEFYISPIFTNSKSESFEGGATAKTDTGYGFGGGFAYNFSDHLSAGAEIAWGESYYRTTLQPVNPGPGVGPVQQSGYIDTTTLRFIGTWNLLSTPITPFVMGGLGWTHIYTDIPAGPPQNSCWYYPWYGPICTTYIPTQNTTKFSYNGAVGLRADVGNWMLRGLVNAQKVDVGGAEGGGYWTQYRLDFGIRFR
jgi:opacity protein-like surface antigen